MKRNSIRSLGIGLFLAGAVFQIQHITKPDESISSQAINEEAYEKSQSELKIVKQQLAQLQLDLDNAKKEQLTEVNGKIEEKESPASTTSSILIVQSGMNSKDISSALESTGIIQNKQDLEDYLDVQNLTGLIQIGEYKLDSSMTIKQIAEKITKK
jgi:hypothetical protein